MVRDKDLTLAGQCDAIARASSEALRWFDDNRSITGLQKPTIDRMLKKNAVEARRLADAARRPMSVGVFGASQSGKSFLTGSFIAPSDNPVAVVFGTDGAQQKLNFLDDVNPAGGDETTGLVTRFSIRHRNPPSGAYPVALRLLSEADIVMILANTFALDLRGMPDEPWNQEQVLALPEQIGSPEAGKVDSGASMDDVLLIEQYIQEEIPTHPINHSESLREEYWTVLEEYAPRASGRDRATLFAPLWGSIPEFTNLYLELREALDLVGHAEFIYASLDAVKDRERGVLHVRTIYHLDPENQDGTFAEDGVERIPVMTEGGNITTLRKAVVTALTAELCITLESKPWDFFEHTDLLDFPGARGRESKIASEFLRGEEKKPQNRAYCFLRGKIAVLFDKYSMDLDLNTMLLCVDDRNQEVRKLAELIQGWVGRTHGHTPVERQSRKTALFLCMTKADLLFDKKAGSNIESSVTTRISKDVEFYSSWAQEWRRDEPFCNIFFLRNPKFMREDIFKYGELPDDAGDDEIPQEVSIIESKTKELNEFSDAFQNIEIVKKHVESPRKKIDAVLALNDGGISYLAGQLAPTCDPDLKFDQIQPRAAALASRMRAILGEYHETGDIAARVEQRRAAMLKVVRALQVKASQIGQFIASLETDETAMGVVFLETARGDLSDRNHGDGGDGGGADIFDGMVDVDIDIDLDLPDNVETTISDRSAPKARSRGLAAVYGAAAVGRWLWRIEDACHNEEIARSYGLAPEDIATVVQELGLAARRLGLAERIEKRIEPVIQYHQRPEEHMHRVAMLAALILNDLVNHLGADAETAADDVGPTQRGPRPSGPLEDGLPVLAATRDETTRKRGEALRRWLQSLLKLAEVNAASSDGGVIDVEQNDRLGQLIVLVPSPERVGISS